MGFDLSIQLFVACIPGLNVNAMPARLVIEDAFDSGCQQGEIFSARCYFIRPRVALGSYYGNR